MRLPSISSGQPSYLVESLLHEAIRPFAPICFCNPPPSDWPNRLNKFGHYLDGGSRRRPASAAGGRETERQAIGAAQGPKRLHPVQTERHA